jgi:hypothetical protein
MFIVHTVYWVRIFKLLRSARIDSKEPIPPGGPVRQPSYYLVPIAPIGCLKIPAQGVGGGIERREENRRRTDQEEIGMRRWEEEGEIEEGRKVKEEIRRRAEQNRDKGGRDRRRLREQERQNGRGRGDTRRAKRQRR